MKLHRTIASGLAFLFLGLLAFSCKKTSSLSPAPPSSPLQISVVSPLEGPAGTTVTIRGAGFSATPGANSVDFNGKPATVTYADDTSLIVTVPLTAGTGNVSVKVKGTTATGPSFTYDYLGVVSTFAGSGAPGAANLTGTSATFSLPSAITVDGSGNLYVADYGNNMVRKINPAGLVSTVLNLKYDPTGVALDGKGNLFVALNYPRSSILSMSLSTGDTSTLSGNGVQNFNNSTVGSNAEFSYPQGLAFDKIGNLYVADQGNNVVRMIDTAIGGTTTFAGMPPPAQPGAQNGAALAASFNGPTDLIFDIAGNCYVADNYNQLIRKITPDGTVSTLAGNGKPGFGDGMGTAATFKFPQRITIDSKGNLYVADQGNNAIRMITPAGAVTTIAGNGSTGSVDGVGPAASFSNLTGIACDANGTLWVSDGNNNKIRKITLQ